MQFKDMLNLLITFGGWCMTLGLYIAKVKQHDKDIEEIKKRQTSTDTLLQSMNQTLTSLDTKMSLLLNDRIKVTK